MARSLSVWFLMGVSLTLFSGCQSATTEPVPSDAAYFPLETGQYSIYAVQEEQYSIQAAPIQRNYQIKEVVGPSYTDVVGQIAYRLIRYRRATDSQPWQADSVWSARLVTNEAIRTENGQDFVSLLFPVSNGLTWNGNRHNVFGPDEYEIRNAGQPFRVLEKSFNETVTRLWLRTIRRWFRRRNDWRYMPGRLGLFIKRGRIGNFVRLVRLVSGRTRLIMAFDKYIVFKRMERSKTGWLILLLFCCQFSSFGQTTRKYLVLLRDKANSPYSLNRPEQFLSQRSILRRQKQAISILERDLPVNPTYVTQLQQAGANVWFTSRWLNAVLVETNDASIAAIQKLPFVNGLEFGRSLATARVSAEAQNKINKKLKASITLSDAPMDYGNSQAQIAQLGVDKMHQQGYHGEGMLIGVLDAGFQNGDKVSFLKPLLDEKRVLATYDFVKKETSVYEDDSHGLECLSAIAATADKQLYGTAYKASFILLRTEDIDTETQIEEANWLIGAEYADSAGVDVISSSLGYTQFDDPTTSYTYQNMDGKTALSSRAAQIATETGMVVVVAAGNEGNNAWRYLSAPADAASVLAIGAVTQTGQRALFSSFGPSADQRVKPDLVARGQGTIVGDPGGKIGSDNGTSLAAPLVAGLAAGFWQAHPRLTAAQVTEALRRSGNQFGSPNDQLGYGIPNFERASILSDDYGQLLIYPNPFSDAEPLGVQWGEIQANTPLDATLTNAAGRVIWQNRYTSTGLSAFTLPNLNLSAGMYFMTLISGDKKRTVKLIKL